MAELRWGAATDTGQVRPGNEDNYLAADGVFVVADGMGGHEAGEVASELAVTRLREALGGEATPAADDVLRAIADANSDIFRAAVATPSQAGMGTTITGLVVIADPLAGRGAPNIDGHDHHRGDPPGDTAAELPGDVTPVVPAEPSEALVLANVGDSRTYLFRHGRLRRVTVDHSYVQELVSTGHITDEEARLHPRRNIVTRALGIEPEVRIDWWTLPIIRGDRFLVCSDGLVDEVPDADIASTLTLQTDPQAAAERLVEMANEAGGRDNITVLVVDVLEGDDPPDPTQEIDVVPTWADEDSEPTPAGTLAVDADPDAIPPEAAPAPPRKRRLTPTRALIGFGVVAAVVAAFVVLAAWARDGYFVAFDDSDEAIIYRGRTEPVLWFEPTAETPTGPSRDELTEESAARVDEQPQFDTRAEAEGFLRELDLATTTTTTTTTTPTTVPPTTTIAPATTAPAAPAATPVTSAGP